MVLTTPFFRRTLCALAALSLASLAHAAFLRRVPSQYPTIQSAVNASVSGDTILVADGIYSGAGNFNIDLGTKNLVVQSESGNPYSCVINCQQLGRGFFAHGGQTRSTVIRGFSIINGKADFGGGMDVNGITILSCIFVNNTASDSGGGLLSYNCNIGGCSFTGNIAKGASKVGGGIADSRSTISNCLIQQNQASMGAGASVEQGTIMTGCTFVDNTAVKDINGFWGSGAIADLDGRGTEINCIFFRNTGAIGGAVYNYGNSTQINCTFYGNSALGFNGTDGRGGAVYNDHGGKQINCIINGNSASSGSGNELYNDGVGGTQSHCLIYGMPTTPDANGNFGGNPLFANSSAGNLHISPGSPAINAGVDVTTPDVATDIEGFPRITGAHRDIGAYEVHSSIQPLFAGSYRLWQPFGDLIVMMNVYNSGTFAETNVTITSVTVSGVNSPTVPLNLGTITGGSFRNASFQIPAGLLSGYYTLTVKGTSNLGPFTSTQTIFLQ